MTKYDIRLRRESLSKGQIEKYKDYKHLMFRYERQNKVRGYYVAGIVVAAMILAIAIFHLSQVKVSGHKMQHKTIKIEKR